MLRHLAAHCKALTGPKQEEQAAHMALRCLQEVVTLSRGIQGVYSCTSLQVLLLHLLKVNPKAPISFGDADMMDCHSCGLSVGGKEDSITGVRCYMLLKAPGTTSKCGVMWRYR